MTSDGNLILSGQSEESGSTNHVVMKIQTSDGSILQKETRQYLYDDTPYYNTVVDNNDKIWILGQTGFNGNTYMRVLDGDDGSHVSSHEIQFKTGTGGNYLVNKYFKLCLNKDGNVIESKTL